MIRSRFTPSPLLAPLTLLAPLVVACAPSRPAESAPTATPSSAKMPAPPPAHPTPPASLLVLSKHDETLSIVDPTSLEVIARAPVGHDPHEVIASADGKLAYVSNYGHGSFHTLAVVDLQAQTALPSIDLGALTGPHGLAYAGGKVWFTAEGAKVIGSYDPSKAAVDWVLGTGQDRTHMLLVSPDLAKIVTTNVSSGTVSFLEKSARHEGPPGPPPGGPGAGGNMPPHPPGAMGPPHMDWEQTLVSVGSGTEGFDIAPSGHELWAADAQDGSIAIVDMAGKKLTQRLAAGVRGANRLKFTPDGKWVLVSSLGGPDLVVFDAASRAESKRIPIGHGAAGIQVQPDSSRAFVACTPDGYVAVVDLRSMSVVGKIQAGVEPDGMAWATVPR